MSRSSHVHELYVSFICVFFSVRISRDLKFSKLNESTAGSIRTGLTPRWNDLDVNQHVNNVKYVGWILESTPSMVLETLELAGVTLEYRRECRKDSVLEFLTSIVENEVYRQSIAAVCIRDWPKEKMLVQILNDSDDTDVQSLIKAEVQKWQQRGVHITYRHLKELRENPASSELQKKRDCCGFYEKSRVKKMYL